MRLPGDRRAGRARRQARQAEHDVHGDPAEGHADNRAPDQGAWPAAPLDQSRRRSHQPRGRARSPHQGPGRPSLADRRFEGVDHAGVGRRRDDPAEQEEGEEHGRAARPPAQIAGHRRPEGEDESRVHQHVRPAGVDELIGHQPAQPPRSEIRRGQGEVIGRSAAEDSDRVGADQGGDQSRHRPGRIEHRLARLRLRSDFQAVGHPRSCQFNPTAPCRGCALLLALSDLREVAGGSCAKPERFRPAASGARPRNRSGR